MFKLFFVAFCFIFLPFFLFSRLSSLNFDRNIILYKAGTPYLQKTWHAGYAVALFRRWRHQPFIPIWVSCMSRAHKGHVKRAGTCYGLRSNRARIVLQRYHQVRHLTWILSQESTFLKESRHHGLRKRATCMCFSKNDWTWSPSLSAYSSWKYVFYDIVIQVVLKENS